MINKDNITEVLLKNNIKPSYQRIKVLEYIVERRNHPTVDEIYNELVKDIPTLSKTTVYNSLDIFIEAKLVKVVFSEDNEARYDIAIPNHGHFKCQCCNTVYDFSIDTNNLYSNDLNDFKINEKNVYFKGICPKCLCDNKTNKNTIYGGKI